LLVINHFIACGWWVVGRNPTDTFADRTWVQFYGLSDQSWEYQYATSFHWSITHFTPASMNVNAQNPSERLFAICIVVFALVGFSYLVGSITGSLTQIRSMQEDSAKQFWNLRRFLKQNNVPFELSTRIQRYLEHAHQQQKDYVSEKSVKILELLSDQMNSELKSTIKVPKISMHPLLSHLNDVSVVTMHRIASKSLLSQRLARNDQLFQPMEIAQYMYCVTVGRLEYCKVSSKGTQHKEFVDSGEDWISEPVLWSPVWLHMGVLTAVNECELILIDAGKFAQVVELNPQAFCTCAIYARNYMAWLNGQDRDQLSDISQGEDIGEMVASFIPSDSTIEEKARRDRKRDRLASSYKKSTEANCEPFSPAREEATHASARSQPVMTERKTDPAVMLPC